MEQVFLHLASEASVWTRAKPPPAPAVPHQTTLHTGCYGRGTGMYFALCDVIVCREMGWPCPVMPHPHTHTLWPNWRCVRRSCWVQEVWDPISTSCRQRTEGSVSWSQDGAIMSRPVDTSTTSYWNGHLLLFHRWYASKSKIASDLLTVRRFWKCFSVEKILNFIYYVKNEYCYYYYDTL